MADSFTLIDSLQPDASDSPAGGPKRKVLVTGAAGNIGSEFAKLAG